MLYYHWGEAGQELKLVVYMSLLDNAYFCMVFYQEFGLARFKKNQVKAMKGLEYALTNLQGM